MNELEEFLEDEVIETRTKSSGISNQSRVIKAKW